MELILNFFSDLILFTAGLAALTLWIVIFVEICDQIKELFSGEGKSTTLEDEEDYR